VTDQTTERSAVATEFGRIEEHSESLWTKAAYKFRRDRVGVWSLAVVMYIRALLLIFVLLQSVVAWAESGRMTGARLANIILEVGEDVVIDGNVIAFNYAGAGLQAIFDSQADRMRIVAPIISLAETDSEQLLLALAANYHSVLDVRYALSDGVIFAAFIHPLGSLTEADLESAITQVATARNTFGAQYSSGVAFFGGSQ